MPGWATATSSKSPRKSSRFHAKGSSPARNRNSSGQDESIYLAPLDEILAKKSTLADDMLSLWNGRWKGDIDQVFEDYKY
jgi:glutamate--cysteine ligase